MISTVDGFTYLDAVLALVPLAKIVPSNDGSYENAEWLDERIAPTANAVSEKLIELKAVEPLFYLRQERDKRIADTDLWGLQDYPTTAEQTAYRQALRDITNTYSSLDDVVWPVKP
jgi:hypothetical protein